MNQYKNLSKNTLVFFITNFGSKVLNILIVPLYTYVLSTEEYGSADLITTIVGLLLPALSLVIYDAGMRFAMDKEVDNKEVLTETIHIFVVSFGVLVLFIPGLRMLPDIGVYTLYLILIFITNGLYQIFTQFAKGIGEVTKFAVSGVVYTISFLIFNLVFLLKMHMKIEGYLLSYILAYLVASVFTFISCRLNQYISLGSNYAEVRIKLIKYGAPLIMNSVIWWVIISSDKLFLSFICGSSSNGIYTVAYKIPSVLTMIGTIFMQAWTISSIDSLEAKDRNKFLNNIFGIFFTAIILVLIIMLVGAKRLISFAIEDSFFEAWLYIPILLWVSIFSLLAQFWSAFYLAEKDTKSLAKSSIIAGALNIVLNYLLITRFAIFGATIASALSCFVMWVCRVLGARRFVQIDLCMRYIMIFVLSFLATIVYYLSSGVRCIGFSLIIICFICVNIKEIKNLFLAGKKVISRRR